MFNWIISDKYQYLKPFNFVICAKLKYFEMELFDNLTASI